MILTASLKSQTIKFLAMMCIAHWYENNIGYALWPTLCHYVRMMRPALVRKKTRGLRVDNWQCRALVKWGKD